MGSFKQISVAALCVGAAIAFGNFVNYSPTDPVASNAGALGGADNDKPGIDSNVGLDELDLVGQRPAAISTLRHRAKPVFAMSDSETSAPNKNSGQLPLPPPSQLANKETAQISGEPKPDPGQPAFDSASSNDLEVPDFSAIAAALENTPMELAPLGSMPMLERNTRTTSNPAGPVENRIQSRNSGVRPQIEVTDTYQVVERPIGFTSDDFDATLRTGLGSGTRAPSVENDGRPIGNVSSLLPVESLDSLVANRTTQPIRAPAENPMRVSATGLVASAAFDAGPDRSRISGARPLDRSGSPPSENRIRTMLPFGLTDGAKTQLVELRSRASSNLSLATTQFVDHIVQPGETLQSISQRYFGKPDFYLDIYLANRNKLRNPSSVISGMMVRVPVYGK